VNRGDGDPAWCTAPNLSTIVGQYVELNFTEPVVIGLLMSGGFTSVYVNNFTVHYTMSSTGDDYVAYGTLEPTQVRYKEQKKKFQIYLCQSTIACTPVTSMMHV
jgi:hypothetical protein